MFLIFIEIEKYKSQNCHCGFSCRKLMLPYCKRIVQVLNRELLWSHANPGDRGSIHFRYVYLALFHGYHTENLSISIITMTHSDFEIYRANSVTYLHFACFIFESVNCIEMKCLFERYLNFTWNVYCIVDILLVMKFQPDNQCLSILWVTPSLII